MGALSFKCHAIGPGISKFVTINDDLPDGSQSSARRTLGFARPLERPPSHAVLRLNAASEGTSMLFTSCLRFDTMM
jgi:hypothetical protein